MLFEPFILLKVFCFAFIASKTLTFRALDDIDTSIAVFFVAELTCQQYLACF